MLCIKCVSWCINVCSQRSSATRPDTCINVRIVCIYVRIARSPLIHMNTHTNTSRSSNTLINTFRRSDTVSILHNTRYYSNTCLIHVKYTLIHLESNTPQIGEKTPPMPGLPWPRVTAPGDRQPQPLSGRGALRRPRPAIRAH